MSDVFIIELLKLLELATLEGYTVLDKLERIGRFGKIGRILKDWQGWERLGELVGLVRWGGIQVFGLCKVNRVRSRTGARRGTGPSFIR